MQKMRAAYCYKCNKKLFNFDIYKAEFKVNVEWTKWKFAKHGKYMCVKCEKTSLLNQGGERK